MAVRCIFCHPEQPRDSEDGVTCDWKDVIFGFKHGLGLGRIRLHFSVSQALRSLSLALAIHPSDMGNDIPWTSHKN